MQTRSKVLIAAAVAATLAAAGLAGSAYADRNKNWGGWRMGHMHERMMGMHDGRRGYGMKKMRQRIRDFADRYDTDKDGKITQAEIDTNRADMFKKHDTNGDGKLSIEEYRNLWLAEQHRQMVRSFQHLDIDGTGAIDLAAYNRRLGHIVEMLDQNNDGALSRDDMKVWRQHNRDRHGMMQGKDQSRMPMMDDDDDDDDSTGKSDQPQ